MLQRLFRLERFGDGLALKLSQRMKAAEAALKEAAAEQLGLGDASAAAVDAAAARTAKRPGVAADARAALAEAERQHAERLHVRERLEALRAKEALHAKLQADAPRVAELERELQRLAAAERLLPALAAAGAAEAALRAAASRREAAGQAHAARQEAATAAAAAWAAAAAEAAAGEPRLALRLDQLAGAQRLEARSRRACGRRRGRRAARRRSRGAAAQLWRAGRQGAGDARPRGRQAGGAARRAEDGRAERLGPGTPRQADQEAAAVQSAFRASGSRARGAGRGFRTHASKPSSAHGAVRTEQEEAYAALRGQAERLLPVRSLLAHLTEKLRPLGAALPKWSERARRDQRERQRMELAAALAADLRDGEPCPVCGSYDQPWPPCLFERACGFGGYAAAGLGGAKRPVPAASARAVSAGGKSGSCRGTAAGDGTSR